MALAAGRIRGFEEIGISQDRLQQIVEIMGDAAGHLADHFHLLRLMRARFRGGDRGLEPTLVR